MPMDIQYGCEKQSKVVYSLNHDITASFTLNSDPELPTLKSGGGMAGVLMEKLTFLLQITIAH
jgi:hypothetical protein